ncbi:MAG: T9SS type A sorting domain-containing protein [Bacteroidales bacterium]|nr:T9SS type A sorting domain-containing protein [Bacteroidales bacterium]
MKKLLLIMVLGLFAFGSNAQQWKKNLPQQDKKANTFFDYQKAFNDYWGSYDVVGGMYLDEAGNKTKAPGWKQFKRWEYFWKSRVDNVTGEFPNKSAWEAWEDYQVKNPSSKSLKGDWEPLGPSNLDASDDGALQESGTGRLNNMTFDPIDDNHFWVGAPSGGVWESTDNGITWTCLTDALPIIGVSDIAIPSNYNVSTNPVIYIGSGDRDAIDDPSIGVLKSTDGGTTWVTTGLTFNASSNVRIGRVLCSPYDANTIIAATSVGVYKSTDAGASWSMMQSGFFIDMELIPTTNTLIATTMGLGSKAFMSSNMADTWTEVFTGDVVNEYRCDVAVTAASTSIVYLITDYAVTDALYGIYKSTNGGASFTKVYDGLTANNLYGWNATNTENDGGQGWYDVALAVSNTDANVVYVGGVNAYVSTDGATSFTICSGWRTGLNCDVVHADHHNAYFRASDDRMYDVNDGGVYYCDNVTAGGSSVWTSITNGIVTGQLYDIGVSQLTEGTIVAGFQDNGTKLLTPTSYPNWNIVKGGDGMCCAIDPTNTATQWGTYVELQVDQTTTTWGSASSIRNGGTAQWAGPLEADPTGNGVVYIGTASVEVYPAPAKNDSKPGGGGGGGRSSWGNLSGTLDGTNFLSALDVFNDGQDRVIWTASPAGCWKSDNTGYNFTLVSGLPANLVTDIAIDEDDYNHVYVCFGGYDAYNVYETTDGGSNWADVSTGLPVAPTGAIVINEQNTTDHEVYVGTDAGVFVKLGTAPWQLYTNGMPFVSITDLEFYYNVNPENSYLCAATYGRGIWKTDCYTPPTLDASISAVVEPQTEYCDPGTIIPTFTLSNIGINALTSADIAYSIDGGTVISQSWTGSLAQGVSVDITFSAISLTLGAHSITATLSNPNGNSVDENSDNDSKQKDYALWDHNMPYTQNFDDFPSGGNTNNYDGGIVLLSKCWVNESNDDIDWSVTSGASPSSSTGPSGDHTSGNGVYLYTESSGSNNAKIAKVSSPVIDLTSYTTSTVTFWYHMYSVDNTIGSLTIDLFYNGTQYNNVSVNWNGTVATSISGDQGDAWYQATVDISAADGSSDFVFTFDALTGSDFAGDMAIDDFSVTGTDASKSTTSIYDLENSDLFSVYPNPSNGRFNIITKNVENESEIEIHDAAGKLVYKGRIENSDTHAVDLQDSPAGIYFIKVQSGNTIVNKKVIIK